MGKFTALGMKLRDQEWLLARFQFLASYPQSIYENSSKNEHRNKAYKPGHLTGPLAVDSSACKTANYLPNHCFSSKR